MVVERHPGSLRGLPDDRLGTVAVSLVVGELDWTPDVAPAYRHCWQHCEALR